MPTPRPPIEELETGPIEEWEIISVIKRSRHSSSPSPFNQIPYIIFKKCRSLVPALLNIFNCCWSQSVIPKDWKVAAIKLIGKEAAKNDPSQPANFRPIALTSCIGKLFTSILKNRWLEFMLGNKYLDRSVQKAFMTATPGCTEHHSKLGAILHEARKRHRSVTTAWLDLANAYGSVHHSLIKFSLNHYYAPPKFSAIVESLYDGIAAEVISDGWSTPLVPLQRGVYQGDPLSVVIFNTVINTLIDTLKTRTDLGYSLYKSSHTVNVLQYADDTCLVANCPAACQHLLNMTEKWLEWAGMKAKPSKCYTVSLQGSTGHTIDPKLKLDNKPLPFIGDRPIKFLGLYITIPHDPSQSRSDLSGKLEKLLKCVDQCPVTRNQKLKIFKLGICPRLNWPLTINQFPHTWIKRHLQPIATRFLKKWAGLAKSANPNLLYLSRKQGGLEMPALSSLHKRLQVSRQCLLLTSPDPCVRFIADKNLKKELSTKRAKFRPATEVRETMCKDPSMTRRALVAVTKARVAKEDENTLLNKLWNLPKQGIMVRNFTSNAATIWSSAVGKLHQDALKFVLNAAVDTLPHNANLYLWWKKDSDQCPLCSADTQNLVHVLNSCKVALELRRYNKRHDVVLQIISEVVKEAIPTTASISVDLDNKYHFPSHITNTDLRPDIVWWDDDDKVVTMIEVTVPYDTLMEEAAERKTIKYADLLETLRSKGYKGCLLTVEVGSRGLPNTSSFTKLKEHLGLTNKITKELMINTAKGAIDESFLIWKARNNRTQ